jgi:Tol biopolymer transport system component/tetratricopeptide (TPR) repeat protein
MGHAVAGGRITEDRRRRAEDRGQRTGGRLPSSVFCLLFLVAFLNFISCAVTKLSESQKDEFKAAVSAPIAETEKGRKPPRPLPVILPVQISFESDPVLYAALSGDGKKLAYVLENEEKSSLWLSDRDSALGAPPQKRLEKLGRISAPALSRDGSTLAFVATDYDAKGDIYVLSLDGATSTPRRLTGRNSADGAPAISANGKRIYFQRVLSGELHPQLSAMDLAAPASNEDFPKVETLTEGAFPAVSPNGEFLAFVSFKEDAGGDIYVLDLKTGKTTSITKGPAQDLYPNWSVNGKWIYFSRFGGDTNGDGNISFDDNAVINRVAFEASDLQAYPVTSETFSAYQPMLTASEILFLSNMNGTGNIWALPLSGQIPSKENALDQMALARLLASRIPQEDPLAVLAYYKVLENFGKDEKVAAEAAYDIGKLYQRMGRRALAIVTYEKIVKGFGESNPEKSLAGIRLTLLQTETAWKAASTDFRRKQILHNAITRIKKISDSAAGYLSPSASSRIQARALITQGQLLGNLAQDGASLKKAISLLDQVETLVDPGRSLEAEALFEKAHLSSRMGRASAVSPIYFSVINRYPRTTWADRSVAAIIDIHLSDSAIQDDNGRIQSLARLAQTHRESTPEVSMGALNRLGDMAFQRGDWPQAKRWYREVLNRYAESGDVLQKDQPLSNQPPTQVAAARLALAEILYREELFRQALDLYEKEMNYRPYEDRLYGLARAAYVQKSIAAADFLFNLGEIPAAQKVYGDLIREDSGLVQAHRGYIKCAALMKQTIPVLGLYRSQLAKDPENPVLLYATGLCLTYLEGKKSLDEGRGLIESAIRKKGQNPYFHQTLGYIFEVSETVYGEPGGLEKALLSYQKAFFLNDPEQDPQNSANLALNLGNIHFLLGQYGRALERYLERLKSKVPFDHEDTEIIFYRRLGAAAFQMNDPMVSINAYSRALELIENRIDPKRASKLMGKLNTTIFDRILTPALKRTGNSERVQTLVQQQSDIHKDLFRATENPFGPSPDPRWHQYKQAMESIMTREEKLIEELSPLITERKNETEKTLSFMLTRARDALEFPDRMIELKAEMLDRLGLAYQEAREWDEAADAFEKAFRLNSALGRTQNLAANRRSVAYNTYMAAGERSGEAKKQLLKDALKQFQELESLLKQYGTISPQEKKAGKSRVDDGSALLNVSLDLALDKTSGSQAAYGFSREQEQRLAQAFISRIETELGVLARAQAAIDQQLLPYQQAKIISDKDLYGVSLISHRDGQLRFALRQPVKAFQSFKRSAELAVKLKNPVSAAMNVVNMAWALCRIKSENPDYSAFKAQLAALDRKTSRLLKRSQEVLSPLVLPDYHNKMGALILNEGEPIAPSSPDRAARNLARLKQAGVHFTHGLDALKRSGAGKRSLTRKALALKAALQLNLAHVALGLGEPSSANAFAKKALATAHKGLLPQYQWRAQLLLGDFEAALETLEAVPLVNAGCGPGEIRRAFASMVSSLVQKDDAESALNLLERLSEIERFQRMAPSVTEQVTPPERTLLMDIFPRIMTLLRLRAALDGAENGQKRHLTERIKQEQRLLNETIGVNPKDASLKNRVTLPSMLTRSSALQEQLLFLLSLSFEMERVADLAVAERLENGKGPLMDRNRELLALYTKTLKGIKVLAVREGTPGVAALFSPYPVEAIDLMETLPDGGRAIRIFEKNRQTNSWTAFVVTPDDILIEAYSADPVFSWAEGKKDILIYEDPWSVPWKTTCPLALSATHLVRSVGNRKPFKKRIVEIASVYKLPADFDVTELPASTDPEKVSAVLPGTQGLLLGGPVYTANTVPTRPEEVPVYGPAMALDQGRKLPLFSLFHELSDMSLVMAPQAATEETALLGHLFSLMGVPTLILPQEPRDQSPMVTLFFDAYGKIPVQEALQTALDSPQVQKRRWINLGYWGMTEAEALNLAEQRFKAYVKSGITAFKNKEPLYALASFENAPNGCPPGGKTLKI